MVLEGIPRELAAEITRNVRIPTIGIGAGPDCDGQILVLHDMLGTDVSGATEVCAALRESWVRQFRRRCANIAPDVQSGNFPSDAESYHAPGRMQRFRFAKRDFEDLAELIRRTFSEWRGVCHETGRDARAL